MRELPGSRRDRARDRSERPRDRPARLSAERWWHRHLWTGRRRTARAMPHGQRVHRWRRAPPRPPGSRPDHPKGGQAVLMEAAGVISGPALRAGPPIVSSVGRSVFEDRDPSSAQTRFAPFATRSARGFASGRKQKGPGREPRANHGGGGSDLRPGATRRPSDRLLGRPLGLRRPPSLVGSNPRGAFRYAKVARVRLPPPTLQAPRTKNGLTTRKVVRPF
jgi:hypothetical protein